MRVEQRTDFVKLIMGDSTDGTIHPEEAVKQASRILIQHLMIIAHQELVRRRVVNRKVASAK